MTNMWMMMMDSDSDKESKLPTDPGISRKLRPLMPRPIYSTPSCCCIPNPNILSWNHSISDHHGTGVKREIQTGTAVSTRWNPTPEQLQALEEMYRRGIRTPSAQQIQQIAAKLRRFGKIEGKNVFYWFQNHKARERQKKRRQLELLAANQPTPAGLSRRYFEIEHHRKVPISSNCTKPSEDSASMHGAVIAAESGKDGWNHKEPKVARYELAAYCCQLDLELSSSSSSSSSINAIDFTARKATAGQENTKPYPYAKNHDNQTTLELFPSPTSPPQQEINIPHTFTKNIKPTHFIEFLPIKN